jgi:hypothetical protein
VAVQEASKILPSRISPRKGGARLWPSADFACRSDSHLHGDCHCSIGPKILASIAPPHVDCALGKNPALWKFDGDFR